MTAKGSATGFLDRHGRCRALAMTTKQELRPRDDERDASETLEEADQ
jgi:hypothetical protein